MTPEFAAPEQIRGDAGEHRDRRVRARRAAVPAAHRRAAVRPSREVASGDRAHRLRRAAASAIGPGPGPKAPGAARRSRSHRDDRAAEGRAAAIPVADRTGGGYRAVSPRRGDPCATRQRGLPTRQVRRSPSRRRRADGPACRRAGRGRGPGGGVARAGGSRGEEGARGGAVSGRRLQPRRPARPGDPGWRQRDRARAARARRPSDRLLACGAARSAGGAAGRARPGLCQSWPLRRSHAAAARGDGATRRAPRRLGLRGGGRARSPRHHADAAQPLRRGGAAPP